VSFYMPSDTTTSTFTHSFLDCGESAEITYLLRPRSGVAMLKQQGGPP
jgi:hypothetical protein